MAARADGTTAFSGDPLGSMSWGYPARADCTDQPAKRFAGTMLTRNADMAVADMWVYCALGDAGRSLIMAAMGPLSARAYHQVLKSARTIAHLAEALQYRPRR